MGYPYHFVNLDEDQNVRRRHLLDSYGQFAQVSVLFIPLLYYLSYGFRLLLRKLYKSNGYQSIKEYQSPVVSRFRQLPRKPPSTLWTRIRWSLDDEIVEGWGTKQELLIAGAWVMWLFVLTVRDTGDGM